jgi:hypothetical protein
MYSPDAASTTVPEAPEITPIGDEIDDLEKNYLTSDPDDDDNGARVRIPVGYYPRFRG